MNIKQKKQKKHNKIRIENNQLIENNQKLFNIFKKKIKKITSRELFHLCLQL